MAKFEVAIYNMEVRQKVTEGEHHKRFNDDWADMHYVEVEAENEELARAKIEFRHPSVQGFVMNDIQALD